MRGNPIPVRPSPCPMAWTPSVPVSMPYPIAWSPPVVDRWSRNIRTALDSDWRRCKIGCLSCRCIGPISRRPLVPLGCFQPVARDPLTPGRQGTPSAADPEKVGGILIPCPVTWYPGDVIAFRSLARRNLLDQGGWRVSNDDSRLWIEYNHSSKRLVHRTAGEHLYSLNISSSGCSRN